jgi:hypothetical protein
VKPKVVKPPTPEDSYEEEVEEPVQKASSYGEESDLDDKDFLERDMKKGKVAY